MLYKISSLLTAKNSFILGNLYLKRIYLNKRTVEFVENLSDVVLHFSTKLITYNQCFLNE